MPKQLDELVSVPAAAKTLRVTPSLLYQQIKKGIIPTHPGNKVRVSEVRAARAKSVNVQHRRKWGRAPVSVDESDDEDLASDELRFMRARAKKEVALAELKRLDLQEREGKLVDAAAVHDAVFRRFREERDALLNWPVRISAVMAAELGLEAGVLLVALEKHVREFLAGRSTRFEVPRPG